MKRISSNKDVNKLVHRLRREGWVYQSGKKHGKAELPGIGKVIIPKSPSDRKALLNLTREIQHLERQRCCTSA